MCRDPGLLVAEADAETEEDLIAHHLRLARVSGEGDDETSSHGHETAASDHPRGVVACLGDCHASDKACDDEGEDEGNVLDPRFHSAGTLDGLEPDGKVVNQDHQSTAGPEAEEETCCDGSLADDAGRDCGILLLPELNSNEGCSQDPGENQKGDNAGVAPSVNRSTPLHRQEEADYSWEEQCRSNGIKLCDFLTDTLSFAFRIRQIQNEDENQDGYGSDGKVDIEAPPPREVFLEGVSKSSFPQGYGSHIP